MLSPIWAYPREDGRYNIIGKSTYYFKDKIRAAGGKWNSTCWVGPIEAVKVCNAILMTRVLAKDFFTKEPYETWATEYDVREMKIHHPDDIYEENIKVINIEDY